MERTYERNTRVSRAGCGRLACGVVAIAVLTTFGPGGVSFGTAAEAAPFSGFGGNPEALPGTFGAWLRPEMYPNAGTDPDCPPGQQSGRTLRAGLQQLTGAFLRPGQTEFPYAELPDPAPPFENGRGEVEIYGSANYFIRYRSWTEFERAGCYERVPLRMFNPGFSPFTGSYGHAWDVRKFRVRTSASTRELLVGGSMSPTHGRSQAMWPDDNFNRRIYFFRPRDDRWLRDDRPVIGTIDTGWSGHSYGGNLIQENAPDPATVRPDRSDPIAFFYERVSVANEGGPVRTEIFARGMDDADHADRGDEAPIYPLGKVPLPATRRSIGGWLAEGPRPTQVEIQGRKFFLVGFSIGDFCTDGYTISFLWSRGLLGPYRPFLKEAGAASGATDVADLRDFGVDLKARYALSWLGRPALYRSPDGGYEMLFHGVSKAIVPENDYSHWPTDVPLWDFFRSIYRTKVRLWLDAHGEPKIAAAIEN